ncbi:MAG: lipopolysaccharide heptosyltransferase II [bacterium]|nr:lipopolysaccharide heptosyltransferase II [bacterium]
MVSHRDIKSQKLLVVMPNWLGDFVMATTFLNSLRQLEKIKNYSISVLVRESWADLLKHDSRVDDVILYKRTGEHSGFAGNVRLAKALRKHKFDSAILLVPSFRSAAVTLLANIPERIGFKGDGRSLFLTHNIPRPEKGEMHFTEELHLLAKSFDETYVPYESLPSIEYPGLYENNTHNYWTVAIGSTYGDAKCWPIDRVADFLVRMVRDNKQSIALVGDSKAAAHVADLKKKTGLNWLDDFGDEAGVVDFTGRTTLIEISNILSRSKMFIGNDSGLMHLSAALGCPTVGIFGSTSPAWTFPKGRWTTAVAVAGFSCSPCFLKNCTHTEFCLETISAEDVYESAHALIKEAGEL